MRSYAKITFAHGSSTIYLSAVNRTIFSCIEGGYWLRRVCLHYTAIARFLLRTFDDGLVQSHRETERRSLGHRMVIEVFAAFHWKRKDIVRRPCGFITDQSEKWLTVARRPHNHCAAALRLPHDDCTGTVRFYEHCKSIVRQPYDSLTGALRLSLEPTITVRSFCSKWPSKILTSPHDRLTATVRSPCESRTRIVRCSYDVSSDYDLTIFIVLNNSELNKIVEATATPREPHDIMQTPSARKWDLRHRTGIIDSS